MRHVVQCGGTGSVSGRGEKQWREMAVEHIEIKESAGRLWETGADCRGTAYKVERKPARPGAWYEPRRVGWCGP